MRASSRTNFPTELSKTVGNIDAERAKEKKENGNGEVVKEESKKKEEGDDDKKSKVDRNAPILPQLKEKFSAAQSYGLDKVNFSLFSSTYSVLEGITFLLLGVSFWADVTFVHKMCSTNTSQFYSYEIVHAICLG